MTPERWERIKEVLEAALSRKAEERPAFLAKACHGDKTLQSEVDKLLTETERTGSFTPAPGLG